MVHNLAKAFGLLSPRQDTSTQIRLLRPTPATVNDLAIYHTRDYLEFVLNSRNAAKREDSTQAEFGLEEVRVVHTVRLMES